MRKCGLGEKDVRDVDLKVVLKDLVRKKVGVGVKGDIYVVKRWENETRRQTDK